MPDEHTGTADEGKSVDEKDGDMLFHQVCCPCASHTARTPMCSREVSTEEKGERSVRW